MVAGAPLVRLRPAADGLLRRAQTVAVAAFGVDVQFGRHVRLLQCDEQQRGQGEDKLADGVKVVDYAGFVDLVEAKDKVQSWL